jgi:hypothetical protein
MHLPAPIERVPAMAPRIDQNLKLGAHGRTVFVKGPIGGWNPGTLAAVFTVVVSQPADGVTAIGESRHTYAYDDPGQNWKATARVVSEGGQGFVAGPATATAWATYADSDGGAWAYRWQLPVTLAAP